MNCAPAAVPPLSAPAATASEDRTARVWDASTGEPITPPLRHEGAVVQASFSPDGQSVLTASHDKTVRLWPLGRETRALDELMELARSYRLEPSLADRVSREQRP